ncbi:spermidine synthase [Kaarinaea lacus]
MAVVWSKTVADVRYEVRTAGQSLRLYTNGVFHSQYNPSNPITSSVWDLLFLPAMFYSAKEIKRVLVLGVGGGAVIQQLLKFTQPEAIVGVEINRVHIDIAKRFFDLKHRRVKLYHHDAIEWLKNYSGPKFDVIIDDLFGESGGEPVRVIDASTTWFNRLSKHLSENGTLVINFVSSKQFKQSAYFKSDNIRSKFNTGFRLSTPATENVIGAFLRKPTTSSELRHNLNAKPELQRALARNKLRYFIRTIPKL